MFVFMFIDSNMKLFFIWKAETVKISKAKDEAVSMYKRTFKDELERNADSVSYFSTISMARKHARITKLAIEMVKLN